MSATREIFSYAIILCSTITTRMVVMRIRVVLLPCHRGKLCVILLLTVLLLREIISCSRLVQLFLNPRALYITKNACRHLYVWK